MSLNFDDAQAGDVKVGDVGQNIYHGVSPADLRALMQQQTEFFMTLVSAYERQYAEFQQRMRVVNGALVVIGVAMLWLVIDTFL